MSHLTLDNHLPGATRVLYPRQDPAPSITALTQFLLRGSNTLSEAERELIATLIPHGDQNGYSANEKMQALLAIAAAVREGGKPVTPALR